MGQLIKKEEKRKKFRKLSAKPTSKDYLQQLKTIRWKFAMLLKAYLQIIL
jgi:hypothetical protein